MTRNPAAEELAAKLRLPPDGLPALRQLTEDQAAILGDLIDAARARRRDGLEAAAAQVLRSPAAGRAALRILRRGQA
jgi:hypothetical protein